MMKMCPYYKVKYEGRTMTYCQHPDWINGKMKASTAAIKKFCPPNTAAGCKIISKPKPKLRRVKAWAAVADGKMYSWTLSDSMHPDVYKPCTILIDEKYLRGKK